MNASLINTITLVVALLIFAVIVLCVYLYDRKKERAQEKELMERYKSFSLQCDNVEQSNSSSAFLQSEQSKFEKNLEAILHNRFLFLDQFNVKILLKRADIRSDLSQVVMTSFLAGAVECIILLSMGLLKAALFPLWVVLLSIVTFLIYVRLKIKRRFKKFMIFFPAAIDMMVRSVRSGQSVQRAIELISQETEEPVKGVFQDIHYRVQLGTSLEDALHDMSKIINIPDFHFLSIVLILQKETGGSLAETIANLAGLIRKRAELDQKIKVLASEGKTSIAIVLSLPVIGGGLLALFNPGYTEFFLNDPTGNIVGFVVLGLIALGLLITSKIIHIDV